MRTMLPRLLSTTLAALLAAPPFAWAGAQGEQVVTGDVHFDRSGATTTIRASDGSIIDYWRLGVAHDETLRFVQPHAAARVLNRVVGPEATRIDGALLANGQVYIVNRAGVFFGGDAVVDVSRLVAAAGDISNDDFLAGVDRFDLSGPVEVESGAEIRAADGAALLGTSVANAGRILAEDGAILLVAGETVYLGEHGSHVLVKLTGPAGSADGAAVANDGRIDAGDGAVRLAAGDAVGLAVRQSGLVAGREIHIDGGAGEAQVAGRLDASDATAGATGGHVEIRGDVVRLEGAQVDASGDSGGGTILVGGDVQGRGEGRNASLTVVDAESELRADALREGDGGTVVAWADGAAGVAGAISARGGPEGGDGGFVETSGKRLLDARTTPDVGAPAGVGGTWLLDPADIRIVQEMGDLDDFVFGNGFPTSSPVAESTVGVGRLAEVLERGGRVVITTRIDPFQSDPVGEGTSPGDITLEAPLELGASPTGAPGASLTLQAARDIVLEHDIDAGPDLVLLLTLTADDSGQDGGGDGVGGVTIGPDVEIRTNGGTVTTSGADLTLASGARIDAGDEGVFDAEHTGQVALQGEIHAGAQVSVRAGTGGSGDLLLAGTTAPARIASDDVGLFAGARDGSADTAAVQLESVEIVGADDGDGTSPDIFTLAQDADLVVDAGLGVFGGPVPETMTLVSEGGTVTVDDASAVSEAGVTDLFFEGESVAVNAPVSAAKITLRHRGALRVEQALVDQLAAPTLELAADVDGTSSTNAPEDLTFAPGVALGLSSPLSDLTLQAGDLRGPGTLAKVVAVSDVPAEAPTFLLQPTASAPETAFAIRQDAAIGTNDPDDGLSDDDIPQAAQFGNGLPQSYELRSDSGRITIADAGKVGLSPIENVDLILVTTHGITLPDQTASGQDVDVANGVLLDLGDNTFTWRAPGPLTVTNEISKITADAIELHGGSELFVNADGEPAVGGPLAFDAPLAPVTVMEGDDLSLNPAFITLHAREVRLLAGDGAGGAEGSFVDAQVGVAVEATAPNGDVVDPYTALQPFFRGPQGVSSEGADAAAPEVLVFQQDAPLTASTLGEELPDPRQFTLEFAEDDPDALAPGGPTERLEVRTFDQSPFGLVVDTFVPFTALDPGAPGAPGPDLVLAAPGLDVASPPGGVLDFSTSEQRIRVRADAVRLRGVDFDDPDDDPDLGRMLGSVSAAVDSGALELAAFDDGTFVDYDDPDPDLVRENPTQVVFQQTGDLALDDLPLPGAFVEGGPAGVDYQIRSREGDVDLSGDGLRVQGTDLLAEVSGAYGRILFANGTAAADLELASLQATAAAGLVVGREGSPVRILVTDDPIDEPTTNPELRRGRLVLQSSSGFVAVEPDAQLTAPVIDLTAGTNDDPSVPAVVVVKPGAALELLNASGTNDGTELVISQDGDLTDARRVPVVAASDPTQPVFAGAPETYRLFSRQGSVTVTDPAHVENLALVVRADDVRFERAPGQTWSFGDFSSPSGSLSVQGLGGEDTSPSNLTVAQDGDIAGANLPMPDVLEAGVAGVAYTVRSETADVLADADLGERAAGSRLALEAGDEVRLQSSFTTPSDPAQPNRSMQSIAVRAPAVLEQDVTLEAAEDLSFGSTLDSAPGGPFAFTGRATDARFGGDVGGDAPLASFALETSGVATFSGTGAQQVIAQGDVLLNQNGRAQPAATATFGKAAGDLRLESQSGSVVVGRNEKLSVAGRLEIAAAQGVALGDTNALALDVDAPTIRIQRRAPGALAGPGGGSQADAGVDVVANTIDFSTAPVAVGTGADPVFGVADPTAAPATLDGFEVAAARAGGRALTAADLVDPSGRLLDARPEGPARTNPAEIYFVEQPRPGVSRPRAVQLASLAASEARDVGIAPREPSPGERLAALRGVVVYDDVARGRGGAPLREQPETDVAAPPAAAETGTGGEPATPPAPVTETRLEPDVVDRAAELHESVFGPDGSNVPRIRETLAQVIEDYRRDTGARRVHGFELRRYIRNRPNSQFEAYRALRELDMLFRVHRRSGLAPGEYRRIQEGWLRRIQPEGIELEELAELIHPSGRSRSGDILDIFGE